MGCDPLAHLGLRFPNLASAIRYAERRDLPFEVRGETPRRRDAGPQDGRV